MKITQSWARQSDSHVRSFSLGLHFTKSVGFLFEVMLGSLRYRLIGRS